MHARMWGGLLQDTVSPMGDMVHLLFYILLKHFHLYGGVTIAAEGLHLGLCSKLRSFGFDFQQMIFR
jgi:hypothetical protein